MFTKITVMLLLCFPLIHPANKIKSLPQVTITKEEDTKLSEKDKEKLKLKMQELKKKYLVNWKNKSIEQKKAAFKNYKEEMDKFCRENFGLSYEEFKIKYRYSWKRPPFKEKH